MTFPPMIKFLDIQKMTQSFQPEIGEAMQRVALSGVFIRGAELQRFEEAYASFIGSRFCIGVGNGFDALRLIMKAWILQGEMSEGDEVIVPANTYIASILAVSANRLTPVFVEPDLRTYNIDSARIEASITERTRAIMVVHLYGRNAMSSEIARIAEKYRLKIIEDNAQAAGCQWGEKRTGSLGHAAAHSFFPSKNLGALGDGGAVTTSDPSMAEMVRTLGNYGSLRKGINDVQGLNSRLDEIQAAVLHLKLARLDKDNERRRKSAGFYLTHIHNPRLVLPVCSTTNDNEHVWHLFVIRCQERNKLQSFLAERGVETLVHYPIPPHRQKAYSHMNRLSFEITEQIHREILSLPLNPVLQTSELQAVVDLLNGFNA